MNTKPNKIIFSVFNDNEALEVNEMSHNVVLHELGVRGYNYKEVRGMYKGKPELSILVCFDSMAVGTDIIKEVEAFCKLAKQESYLFIHNDNKAEMRYLSGETVDMGTFKSMDNAIGHDSYTYDAETKKFWVVE